MTITRRNFLLSMQNFGLGVVGANVIWSVACGQSPTAPSSAGNSAAPTTAPTNIPSKPSSPYGTFHRGGFAGITGTLAQVLTASKLNPQISSAGLLTSLDGRTPPLVTGSTQRRGYFFHVRGQWFGGSVHNITLNPSDAWDVFDWNGTNP